MRLWHSKYLTQTSSMYRKWKENEKDQIESCHWLKPLDEWRIKFVLHQLKKYLIWGLITEPFPDYPGPWVGYGLESPDNSVSLVSADEASRDSEILLNRQCSRRPRRCELLLPSRLWRYRIWATFPLLRYFTLIYRLIYLSVCFAVSLWENISRGCGENTAREVVGLDKPTRRNRPRGK